MFRLNTNTSLFVLTLNFLSIVESARILCLFPMPSKSHQRAFKPLTQELARRGHEVTVFTHYPSIKNGRNPEGYTEFDMINVATMDIGTYLVNFKNFDKKLLDQLFLKDLHEVIGKQLQFVKSALGNYSRDHFDLIFLESAFSQFLVFSHIFNVPVIKISCCGAFPYDYLEIGAPNHLFLYPCISQRKVFNLTRWEKIYELFQYYEQEFIMMPKIYSLQTQQVRAIFGQDVPSIKDLKNNVDMLFVQAHSLWEENVPVPPNVVRFWGAHLKSEHALSTDLQGLLNASSNGIVYVSFGSIVNTSSMPNNTIRAITRALSRISYDVFFKWEEDTLPEQPKNVHIGKWWPQEDLLRHPKVKLFITHGGLFSTHEAILGGVPVISIPFFGDQFYNAEKCVNHKIGVKLDLRSITEDTFYNAINTVLEDENYRRNVIKLRSLMMDQPQSALDRAVWWTEYVLRHSGARHLRSPAANISWAQYYEMELVMTVIFIIISMLILISLALYFCFKGFLTFRRETSLKSLCYETVSKIKSN